MPFHLAEEGIKDMIGLLESERHVWSQISMCTVPQLCFQGLSSNQMKVTGYKVDCLSPWQPKLHSAIFLACAAERKCYVPFRANEMIFRGFYTKQGRVRVSHLFQNVHGRHILQLRLSGTKEWKSESGSRGRCYQADGFVFVRPKFNVTTFCYWPTGWLLPCNWVVIMIVHGHRG